MGVGPDDRPTRERKRESEISERQRTEGIRDLNRTIYLFVAEESKPTLD